MDLVAQLVPIDGGGSILSDLSGFVGRAGAFDDTVRSLCTWSWGEGDTLPTMLVNPRGLKTGPITDR